ncbi:MAG: MMPL family transporter [Spirochaetaceae bacterium]
MKINLGRFAVWITENRVKVLLMSLLLTIIMILGASRLTMEMSFFSILPDHTKQFKDLKKIMDDFPFASNMTVVVDAKNIKDPIVAKELLVKTVDEITTELNKNKDYISSVLGKVDQDLVKNHGLMLTKPKNINRISDLYRDGGVVSFITNMNNDFEEEYSGNEDNLKEDEQAVSAQFKNLENILILIEESLKGNVVGDQNIDETLSDYLYGEEYLFNKDTSQAAIYVLPSFRIEDLNILVPGVNYVENLVKEIAEKNGLTADLTGLCTVSRDEMTTSSNGFVVSLFIAIILILTVLIVVLKMKSVPFIIGIPLITGIIWTVGVTGFTVGRLNIVTAMYMIALIGLGVDYAIHIITNYVIEKESGKNYKEAIEITYNETCRGVITGALTTAVAFLALLISNTTMLKELGLIAGIGIICELLATLVLIPLLLSFREKRGSKKIVLKTKIKASIASGIGLFVTKYNKKIIVITLIFVALISINIKDIGILTNLMEMEAKGLRSIELQDEMVEEFEMAPDGLMIISDSITDTKELSNKLKKLSSVKSVESIADYLPTDSEFLERTKLLNNFKKILSLRTIPNVDMALLLDELYRLEANLMELSEMSYMGNMMKMTNALNEVTGFDDNNEKFKVSVFDRLFKIIEDENYVQDSLNNFQIVFDKMLVNKLITMSNTDKVVLNMLPENIQKSFISSDGKDYLISITPISNPWHEEFREIYKQQVQSVTDRATGMILASDELTNMTKIDGVKTSTLALIIVFILLLIDFKSFKLALMTISPLILSFISLFAVMAIFKIDFDFINFIAIPLLIGIGIDDAIHISHRYLLEGVGSMDKVIKHAGSAVLLTSITTVIGFASFIPSPMVGLSKSGIVFACAIIFAFIYSILFFPSLLIFINEKRSKK